MATDQHKSSRRPFSSSFPFRFVIVLFAVLIVVSLFYAVALLLTPLVAARSDFIAYYAAAQIIREGKGEQLYDLDLQRQVQGSLLESLGVSYKNGPLPFVNPSYVALLFVPLVSLPLVSAHRIWMFVNAGILFLTLVWVTRRGASLKESRLLRVLIFLGSFSFLPTVLALVLGQLSILVLFGVAMSYLFLKSKREYLAGLLLSVALVKPHLLVGPLFLMVFKRRWRAVATFSLGGGVALSFSVLSSGWRGLLGFVQVSTATADWVSPAWYLNLFGVLAAWLGTENTLVIYSLTTVLDSLVFVALLLSWRGPWKPNGWRFDLMFSQAVMASLLAGPHVHAPDLVLLILPGAVVSSRLTPKMLSAGAYRSGWMLLFLGYISALSAFVDGWGYSPMKLPTIFTLVSFIALSTALIAHRDVGSGCLMPGAEAK